MVPGDQLSCFVLVETCVLKGEGLLQSMIWSHINNACNSFRQLTRQLMQTICLLWHLCQYLIMMAVACLVEVKRPVLCQTQAVTLTPPLKWLCHFTKSSRIYISLTFRKLRYFFIYCIVICVANVLFLCLYDVGGCFWVHEVVCTHNH